VKDFSVYQRLHHTTQQKISSSSIHDGMQTLLDYYISGNITWRYSPINKQQPGIVSRVMLLTDRHKEQF